MFSAITSLTYIYLSLLFILLSVLLYFCLRKPWDCSTNKASKYKPVQLLWRYCLKKKKKRKTFPRFESFPTLVFMFLQNNIAYHVIITWERNGGKLETQIIFSEELSRKTPETASLFCFLQYFHTDWTDMFTSFIYWFSFVCRWGLCHRIVYCFLWWCCDVSPFNCLFLFHYY